MACLVLFFSCVKPGRQKGNVHYICCYMYIYIYVAYGCSVVVDCPWVPLLVEMT